MGGGGGEEEGRLNRETASVLILAVEASIRERNDMAFGILRGNREKLHNRLGLMREGKETKFHSIELDF